MCEANRMNAADHRRTWLVVLLALGVGFVAAAQPTNAPENATARSEPASPQKFDESAFRIVAERNIFNANRSGGAVRLPSRRPTSVEFFALVGTMEYEKGAFAFFEGSSSEFTKAIKADSVIGGHKLMSIAATGVKLEADGKEIELPVGSQMRREDQGAWQVTETRGGFSTSSSANGESSSRNGRSERNDFSSRSRRDDDSSSRRNGNLESGSRPPAAAAATPSANEDEVLKRLMERREKESQ
jgi:hypothetical protein